MSEALHYTTITFNGQEFPFPKSHYTTANYRPRTMVEADYGSYSSYAAPCCGYDYMTGLLDRAWALYSIKIIRGKRLADVVLTYPRVARYLLPPDWDGPNYCDGEWLVGARLPCRAVEFCGKLVPLYACSSG